jgi:hypothetical protein
LPTATMAFNFSSHRKPNIMKLSSAIGGLAGAAALTVLNETVKNFDKNAPRLDLLGMNTVAKVIKGPKGVPLKDKVKPVSLAGDMISNALYFGMANSNSKGNTLWKGAFLGLGAGLSAIAMAKPLGSPETTNKTPKTQAMTVAYYIIGGLVAAAVINLLGNKK